MNRHIEARSRDMSYRNFNVSIYAPVSDVLNVADTPEFNSKFELLQKNIHIGRIYLECYRGRQFASKEQVLKAKEYFESKGIRTAGGITTDDAAGKEGFISLCYSDEKDRKLLEDAVRLNAELFDEMIFDDFYFANCRCPKCIANKGNRTWRQFRLEQKLEVTKNIVMKTAKEVNPDCNVIIKYPQWYEFYNETGYNPGEEPKYFDSIYTGTETRNPSYTQQHLPKYLSYFIMHYLDTAAPGRNLGGWYDPFECPYNMSSYLEQGYLTLFARPKEVMLFCLAAFLVNPEYRIFIPSMGYAFEEMDDLLDQLGRPVGIPAYRPVYGMGEDYVHNYLGMCGIPLVGTLQYPENAKSVFLAESAADDPEIIEHIHNSLMQGTDVVVTSGFLRKAGAPFRDTFMNVTYSTRKALVQGYGDTKNGGVNFGGMYMGKKPVLIPQLDYCTNDVWELAAGYGESNNFPIVLRVAYGNAKLSVITIPDNMGDLYNYPAEVLNMIRSLFAQEEKVRLLGNSQAMLFTYDNDTFILRSDLPYAEDFKVLLPEGAVSVTELTRGYTVDAVEGAVDISCDCMVNYAFKINY